MFGSLSLLTLQEYWWFLVAVLGALFVFMTFVQGGQVLLGVIAHSEKEKNLIIASLGRKWELSFTALVMFGGALFAAFPLFYAVSFSGAYFLWMAILFCFIIQAVSYEYRKKPNNFFGQRNYERFLYINGSLGIILIGVALGGLFSGGNFIKNDMNLAHWANGWYGLETIRNPFNLLFGLMLFFLARVQAALYFINNIVDESVIERTQKILKRDSVIFLLLFLSFLAFLLTLSGVRYHDSHYEQEAYLYLHNLLSSLPIMIAIVLGVVLILWALFITIFKASKRGIWWSGVGTVIVVVALFSLIGFQHTAIYPSLVDVASSLSIENSSGSHYTLKVMAYVSLMVPFVLGYITLVWRSMDKQKLTSAEVEADSHHY